MKVKTLEEELKTLHRCAAGDRENAVEEHEKQLKQAEIEIQVRILKQTDKQVSMRMVAREWSHENGRMRMVA